MSAPTMLASSAIFTRHDAHTRKRLDDYRARRSADTDVQLLAAAYRAETLPTGWVADGLRSIVEHEVEWRRVTKPGFADWWLTAATGGAR